MKNLVVYFSLEGNTKFLVEAIAKEIECDVLELKPKKAYSKGRISKYFSGGRSVFFKQKPELISKDVDINNYKNIIIGTPIWCGTYAPPIDTFISNNKIKYKNVAIFACHGGGGADKCFNNLKSILKDNNIIGKISFVDPLKGNKEKSAQDIREWIVKIIK